MQQCHKYPPTPLSGLKVRYRAHGPFFARLWYRAAALMSQNHMTNYFRKAKEHGIQWQLNRSYRLTCTSGRVAAQFNWHGNSATAKADTVLLGKCQAACISKITVELNYFLALWSYEWNEVYRRVLWTFYGPWHQTQLLYMVFCGYVSYVAMHSESH